VGQLGIQLRRSQAHPNRWTEQLKRELDAARAQ
jgi:hypothetical protein